MVVVDGKRVVHVESFMVKNDQEAKVDVSLEGSELKFSFIFKAGEGQTGSWSQVDGRTKFTFVGWSNQLGTCTSDPMKLGDMGEKKLYFQFANFAIGDINVAQFFLLLEGA